MPSLGGGEGGHLGTAGKESIRLNCFPAVPEAVVLAPCVDRILQAIPSIPGNEENALLPWNVVYVIESFVWQRGRRGRRKEGCRQCPF